MTLPGAYARMLSPLNASPRPMHFHFGRPQSTLRWQLCSDGQLADTLAGSGKDRIRQRRHDTRGAGLADPARRFIALHELHFDARRFVDAQHAIVAKVGLLDAAVL